jgi:hypothetical protein
MSEIYKKINSINNIQRQYIDWAQTGNKLFRLRSDNPNLRRYVCSVNKKDSDACNWQGNCDDCNDTAMDRNISRPELAHAFNVNEGVIYNWENARSIIGIEDLLFYCQIAQVRLEDILVFQEETK